MIRSPNIVQYLLELSADVTVKRNDEIGTDIEAMQPQKLSSRLGLYPQRSRCVAGYRGYFAGKIPLFGICLVIKASAKALVATSFELRVMRQNFMIYHNGSGVFAELDNPFEATRYHSLVVARQTLPDCLEVTAWTEENGEVDAIMGFRHRELDVEGVQFHPESILTEHGHQLLNNFLQR